MNGEVELEHVPQNQNCPFCDSKLPERRKKSYINSAQAELERIMLQMKGLEETEVELQSEKTTIEERLELLNKEREQLEGTIQKELQPKAEELRQLLNDYRSYIQIQKELQIKKHVK